MHVRKINLPSKYYKDEISWKDRYLRISWSFVRFCFCLFPPKFIFKLYRWVLLLFGAHVGRGSKIYPSAAIHSPWKLSVGNFTCIGPNSTVYNISQITIGDNVTISQGAFLCTGSHDITLISKPQISKPITIENHAWICADAFVGPGVTIGEGSVLSARSVAFKTIPSWQVYTGNPITFLKKRSIKSSNHVSN